MARTSGRESRPTLLMDAHDVRFVFPGANSWSGEFHGKDEHRRWLRAARPRRRQDRARRGRRQRASRGTLTVCIRGRSYWDSPQGERVYENRFVIWAPHPLGQAQRLRGLRGHREGDRARRVPGATCLSWPAPDPRPGTAAPIGSRRHGGRDHHRLGDDALPGFEDAEAVRVETPFGACAGDAGRATRASRRCTSRATARATRGSQTTSPTGPTSGRCRARRERGGRLHRMRRRRPDARARLAGGIRRSALPLQPPARRELCTFFTEPGDPRRGHWILHGGPFSRGVRAARW